MGSRTSSPGTQTLPAATDLCPAQARAKCCIASTILRSPRYCLCCQIALHLLELLEGVASGLCCPSSSTKFTFLKAFLNVYMCLEGAMNS